MAKQITKKAANKSAQPAKSGTRGAKRARDTRAGEDASQQGAPPPKRQRVALAKKKAGKPSPAALNKTPTERLDVYVCGTGDSGELGVGGKPTPVIDDPTLVERPRLNTVLSGENAIGGGVVHVSVGGIHCAALTVDGRVVTWGANDTGNLGRDTSAQWDDHEWELNPLESTPAIIPAANFHDGGDAQQFTQVLAIDNATFALATDGRVWGWGQFRGNDGAFGFLKDRMLDETVPKNDRVTITRPVLIPGIDKVKELAGGANHVLALTHDGNVYAWGAGTQHELGRQFRSGLRTSTPYDSLVPHRVPLPRSRSKITHIFAGPHHSFAVDDRGRVWAWGLNNAGQTGIPPTAAERDGLGTVTIARPTVVQSLAPYRVRHIAGGIHHSVVCTHDGQVLAWGSCYYGQAGQASLDQLPADHLIRDSRGRPSELVVPTAIPDITTANSVAAGIDCGMAVLRDGRVLAWGYAEGSRIGLGTNDPDEKIETPRALKKDVNGKTLTWAECGGRFSVVALPAETS